MTRTLSLIIAAVLATAGCGGGKSDEEQVRETVAAFGQATAQKDYQRLCDQLLAPRLLETLTQIGLPCELALQRALEEVEDPRLVIGTITVEGDKARAEVRTAAEGQKPSRDVLELIRIDGRWKIAQLGGASPRERSSPEAARSPTPAAPVP